MTVEVPLTRGKWAVIDDEDSLLVSAYKWHAVSSHRSVWYARSSRTPDGTRRSIPMHRLILGVIDVPDVLVDHEDRDGLNNRRSNLRLATPGQNKANSIPHAGTTSRFKGVKRRTDRIWVAQIDFSGERTHLGYFESEIDAARVYDYFALQAFGEFARLNCPNDSQSDRLLATSRRKIAHGEKSHCPRGHPYTGSNLIIDTDGGRRCLICRRRTGRASAARIRQETKRRLLMSESSEIVFVEPPADTYEPKRRGVASIKSRLAPLEAKPGVWARVHGPKPKRQNVIGWAGSLKNGKFSDIKPGEYETVVRQSDDDQQWYVWARYVAGVPMGEKPVKAISA